MFEKQLNEMGYDVNIRANDQQIKQEFEYFQSMSLLTTALDLTHTNVMILNRTRQLVYANKNLLTLLATDDINNLIGKRPGELVNCKYSDTTKNGCGTDTACLTCGALSLIVQAITENINTSGECSIPLKANDNSTLNLQLSISPYQSESSTFYFVTLQDVTDTLQKRALERIFFHDILNTSGAIRGILQLLESEVQESVVGDVQIVRDAFDSMIDEINFQKVLGEAEHRDIESEKMTLFSLELIQNLAKFYQHHNIASKKKILVSSDSLNLAFESDYALLKRVIGNMIKNALEATATGENITIGTNKSLNQDTVTIWVHNQAAIPEISIPRIFYKNFSSKGKGRGLGTYSIKLIGETYLHGKVGFTTNQLEGTTFYIELPLH